MSVKLLAFAGSLRKGSLNKQLVQQVGSYAQSYGAEVTFIDLMDYSMPLYNEDIQNEHFPTSAHAFKQLLKEHDGFFIASPEYNSAFSGVLKNAIDWASRTEEGEEKLEAFKGKTAAIMTATPGSLGGIRGLPSLRLVLSNMGVLVLPTQLAFGRANEGFNADGTIKDETIAQRAKLLAKELVEFTEKIT